MDSGGMLESLAESALLAQVARQDADAFAAFYDRTSPVLFAIANSILRDATLAEDVLQEVYLQIWNKAEVYDPALGKPISWCIAITRHKALDRLRSTKRRELAHENFGVATVDDSVESNSGAAGVELRDAAILAKDALGRLPENQRRAIELAFLQGLPHAEIAESMEQPLGTVKAWIRRGLIELREQLKNYL
jgi:RNA polymerase sigma-70 factor, ECF subfamily